MLFYRHRILFPTHPHTHPGEIILKFHINGENLDDNSVPVNRIKSVFLITDTQVSV